MKKDLEIKQIVEEIKNETIENCITKLIENCKQKDIISFSKAINILKKLKSVN